MPVPSIEDRLEIAVPDIRQTFAAIEPPILRKSQIEEVLNEYREFWRLTQSVTAYVFIDFLLRKSIVKRVQLPFPNRKETRYLTREVSPYQLAVSLRPNSYLSHLSAVYLHQLTEQVPKTIYCNSEQAPQKQPKGELTQERIDWAFHQNQRISKNIARYGDHRICLISGGFTDNAGVALLNTPLGEVLPVTDMERTMIDIVVRPAYAGGVFEVLKAFKLSHGRASINRLVALLQKLNYAYPYHQAIGFCLQRSGVYRESQISLLRQFEMNFDFYLAHHMDGPAYSEEWKLFYPKGL